MNLLETFLNNLKRKDRKTLVLVLGLVLVILILLIPRGKKEEEASSGEWGSKQGEPLIKIREPKDEPGAPTDGEGVIKREPISEEKAKRMLDSSGVYQGKDFLPLEKAIESKDKVRPSLPIYIEDFETSVGKKTTINIFSVPGDPLYALRLEIYNINYHDDRTNPILNPDVTAFKESFLKAKEELERKGISMQDVYFIFGTRDYIQETVNYWVETLGLL